MKQALINLLHTPKVLVPSALVVALVVGGISYTLVGKAPVVSLPATMESSGGTSASGTTDLSFLRTGRLATLSVKEGDTVKQGQILATLEASDALGALNQAKGALELAKAQYASMDVQYANAKQQQDVLVQNAYRTMLSSGLAPVAKNKRSTAYQPSDSGETPTITGTYSCDKEGSYIIEPYPSSAHSGFSYNYSGLESGSGTVVYFTPQPLGSCGLSITFPEGYSSPSTLEWVVEVPNTLSASYVTNKNAYDLAVATRDQVLKQFEANLGKSESGTANVAQASVDAAEGAYEAAQAAYNGTVITAPADGTVSFVDANLKVGQTVAANKAVISITR